MSHIGHVEAELQPTREDTKVNPTIVRCCIPRVTGVRGRLFGEGGRRSLPRAALRGPVRLQTKGQRTKNLRV